jgi:hypothetical protein
MEEMVMEKHGISERVLRELIRSPKFKASLKIMLNEIDPEAAGGLVKALLWEDVETFMGTAAAMPAIVNYTVAAVRELMTQLNAFPTPMLVAFLSQLVESVDFEAMEKAVGEFKILVEKLHPVVEGLKEASAGVASMVGSE